MFFLFLTGLKSPTSCVFSYRLHDWGTKGAIWSEKNCCLGFLLWRFLWGTKCFFAKWGEPGTTSFWQEPIHVEDAKFYQHFFKLEKAPKWLKNLQFPKNSIWTSHELTKINLERTIFFVNRKTTLAQKKSCSSTLCQSTTQLQFAVLSSPGRCFSHLGVILGSDFVGLEDPLAM